MKTTKKLAHRAGIMLIAFCIAVRLLITAFVAADLIKTVYSVRWFNSLETEMTDDGQMRLIYPGQARRGAGAGISSPSMTLSQRPKSMTSHI